MVSVPLWIKSDRGRRIVALVCFFLVEIFVLLNLILSSDHPTEALSWTTLSSGDVSAYLGTISMRACVNNQACQSVSLRSVSHESHRSSIAHAVCYAVHRLAVRSYRAAHMPTAGCCEGLSLTVDVCAGECCRTIQDKYDTGASCADAGGWVIASYVIVIIATIVPLFLMLNCGCVRVPYPRIIGTATSFAAFVWCIVAVSKWSHSLTHSLAQYSHSSHTAPAYSSLHRRLHTLTVRGSPRTVVVMSRVSC